MLKKEFALSIKAAPDTAGIFEGYASTFGGDPDSYGDVITPGAFAATLAESVTEGDMPMMFFGHDSGDLPIGDWIDMREDRTGLLVKGQIALDDPMGARVYGALKAGRVRGLSIGYRTMKSHQDDKFPGINFLDEIDLYEVSVVNIPANESATITTVKAKDEIKAYFKRGENPPLQLIEKLLRDAEFPNALATAFVSAGKSAFRQGDLGDEAKKAAEFLEKLRG